MEINANNQLSRSWIERIPGGLATTVALSALGVGGVSWAIMRYAPKLKELSSQHRAIIAGGISLVAGSGTWQVLRPLKVELVVGEEDWSEFPADGRIRLTQEHRETVNFDMESSHPLAVWGTLRSYYSQMAPLAERPPRMSNAELVELILEGAKLAEVFKQERAWSDLLLKFNCIDAETIDRINAAPKTGHICLIAALRGMATPSQPIDSAWLDLRELEGIDRAALFERAQTVRINKPEEVVLPNRLCWIEEAAKWNELCATLGFTWAVAEGLHPKELQTLLESREALKELTHITSIRFLGWQSRESEWHPIAGTTLEWTLEGPFSILALVNTNPQAALEYLNKVVEATDSIPKPPHELQEVAARMIKQFEDLVEVLPRYTHPLQVFQHDLQSLTVELRSSGRS